MSALASNLASLFIVPPAVVTGVVPVANGCAVVGVDAGTSALVVSAEGAANTNAEGGSPPIVSASAAFSA
jgi:hypothetical protein